MNESERPRLAGGFVPKRRGILEHYKTMSKGGIILFDAYLLRADLKTGNCYLTNERLQELLPLSLSTIKRAKRELLDKGWIRTLEGQRAGIHIPKLLKYIRVNGEPFRGRQTAHHEPFRGSRTTHIIDNRDYPSYDGGRGFRGGRKEPPNPQVQRFLKTYAQMFRRYSSRGEPPPIFWGKDGKLAKQLLKVYPFQRLLELLERFFHLDDEWIHKSGYTLGAFRAALPRLLMEKKDVRRTYLVDPKTGRRKLVRERRERDW